MEVACSCLAKQAPAQLRGQLGGGENLVHAREKGRKKRTLGGHKLLIPNPSVSLHGLKKIEPVNCHQ